MVEVEKRRAAHLMVVAGLGIAGLAAVATIVAAFADELRWSSGLAGCALAGLVVAGVGAYAATESERRRGAAFASDLRASLKTLQTRVDPLREYRQFNHLTQRKFDQLTESVASLRSLVEHELVSGRDDRPVPSHAAEPVAQAPSSTVDAPTIRTRRLEPDELADSVWMENYAVPASYTYKLHESKRRRHLLPMLGHRQRVWAFNDKLAGYQLAAEHGISSPQTISRSITMAEFDWDAAPARFAIKPHNGAANRGVFLLQRRDDGRFDELLAGRVMTVDMVVDEYAGFVASRHISPRFAVEELLAPRSELSSTIQIPDDLKVYCFYDRPVVIMQRRTFGQQDRDLWRFKIWSSDWSDMGPVKYADRYSADLERPSGGDAVLEAAETLATTLAIPFIRLDLYDTDRGPVFGEVSPHPGPPEVWDSEADEFLGKHWEIAEARLLAERRFPSEVRP